MSVTCNASSTEQHIIIQGQNTPIELTFPEDVSNYENIHVGLYDNNGKVIKHWDISELVVEGCLVYCPLLESETFEFPIKSLVLQVRAKDDNGDIHNYVSIEYKVIKRNDHHNLTGGGGDDSNP